MHVTLPLHPEGHSIIEREFRDMNACIRAVRAAHPERDMLEYLDEIQLALNTAYSRALGTTPFEACHGFPPRSALENILERGLDPKADAEGEPQDYAQLLVQRMEELRKEVEEQRRKLHDENAKKWAESAQGKQSFSSGEYVLRKERPKTKTDLGWSGPYVVVGPGQDPNSYVIEDVGGGNRRTEATANLHQFKRGRLTQDEARAEATRSGEYHIERVKDHAVTEDGELWFFVDWLGYPPTSYSDDDAWVTLADAHWAPAIKDYIKQHRLGAAVKTRVQKLGSLPRS